VVWEAFDIMSGSSSSSSSSSCSSVSSSRSNASQYALDTEQQNFILQSIQNHSSTEINIRSLNRLYAVIIDEYLTHFSSSVTVEHIKHTIRLASCRQTRVKVMEKQDEQEHQLYEQLVEQQEVAQQKARTRKEKVKQEMLKDTLKPPQKRSLSDTTCLKLHALEALNLIKERERQDKSGSCGKKGRKADSSAAQSLLVIDGSDKENVLPGSCVSGGSSSSSTSSSSSSTGSSNRLEQTSRMWLPRKAEVIKLASAVHSKRKENDAQAALINRTMELFAWAVKDESEDRKKMLNILERVVGGGRVVSNCDQEVHTVDGKNEVAHNSV